MGYVPDWSRQDHKKTGAQEPHPNVKDMGNLFNNAPKNEPEKAEEQTTPLKRDSE